MKMTNMHLTILAFFLTDTRKWQVLKGKEKHLLDSFEEELKNKVPLKQM